MANIKKNLPRETEIDWFSSPGKHRLARLQRLITTSDTKQHNLIEKTIMPDEIPQPNMSTLYGLDENNKWKQVGNKCLDCGKVMSKPAIIEKHPIVCTKALLINKEQEQDILSLTKRK